MVVTTHDTLHIMLSQHIGDLIPVVHIAIAQRVVGEDKDRRIACGRDTVEVMFQPCYILWRHMSVCHTDDRA